MIVLFLVLACVCLALAMVGERAFANAERLRDAIFKRLRVEPKPRPRPHPLRYSARLFLVFVGAPFVGAIAVLFTLLRPERRRPMVALIALGWVKQAWREGRIREYDIIRFDEVATSWVFRYGEALPEGREIPVVDDDE